MIINGLHRVEIATYAVEDNNEWPKVDLVFTGPPYYNTENYGVVSQAYLNRCSSYQHWLREFWGVFIEKANKSTQKVVLNLGTFRLSKTNQIDYPKDVTELFINNGWFLEKEYDWKIASFGKNTNRKEKILVFNKHL